MAYSFFRGRHSAPITVSGKAVTLEFLLHPGDSKSATVLAVALGTKETVRRVQGTITKHVSEGFGPAYAVDPILVSTSMDPLSDSIPSMASVAPGSVAVSLVTATVTTPYSTLDHQEDLAELSGTAVEKIRRELRDWLRKTVSDSASAHGTWRSEDGVRFQHFLLSPETPDEDLRRELAALNADRSRQRLRRMVGSIFALALILIGGGVSVAYGNWIFAPIIGAYAVAIYALTLTSTQGLRESSERTREIERELDFRDLRSSIGHEHPEARAQKLFQLHSVELKRYYDQTLRQGGFIFWVGVGCIALGFAVIVGGFVYLAVHPKADVPQKVVIAIVTGIGGVLANFIAVIYLRMFSATVASVAGFHQRLVATHRLHFGNFLVAKISNADATLRNQALADMAVALSETITERGSGRLDTNNSTGVNGDSSEGQRAKRGSSSAKTS